MVMIRCPDCGQRVLDVASSCPKCRRVLIQNPLETHDWGSLQTCGRCGKHIDRSVVLCPYCGHHVRAARIARRVALGSLTALVVLAAGIGVWRSGMLAALRDAATGHPRAAAAPAPIPFDPVRQETYPPSTTREPEVAPIVAAAPDTAPDSAAATPAAPATRTPTPERPAAVTRTPTPEPAPPLPADLTTRWTASWANLRTDRSIESEVVRVLPPGRALDVRDMRNGWWAVHEDGALVGYIANSVLTANAPEF